MPPAKNVNLDPSPENPEMTRLTNLLALLLVKGEQQPEKIKTLANVGYSAAEIGQLLGTSANTVSVTLYKLRKSK